MKNKIYAYFFFSLWALTCLADPDGGTPTENLNESLDQAVRNGSASLAKALIKRGASLDLKWNGRYTPLHTAAYFGHSDVAEVLISNGAKLEAGDEKGGTPLHAAALGNQAGMIAFLVKRGANVSARDNLGQTPLHVAISGGELEILEALVDLGVSSSAVNIYGETPLHLAAQSNNALAILDFLYIQKVDLNACTKWNLTPLHYAAQSNKADKLLWLIRHGANAAMKDSGGYFPYDYYNAYGQNDYLDEHLKWPALQSKRDICNQKEAVSNFEYIYGLPLYSGWMDYCSGFMTGKETGYCRRYLVFDTKDFPAKRSFKSIARFIAGCIYRAYPQNCQGRVDAEDLEALEAQFSRVSRSK